MNLCSVVCGNFTPSGVGRRPSTRPALPPAASNAGKRDAVDGAQLLVGNAYVRPMLRSVTANTVHEVASIELVDITESWTIIDRHALRFGRQNTLVELRNDLIGDAAAQVAWAARLAQALTTAMQGL